MNIVQIGLNSNCKVQLIPGNGNCLFGAIAHQIYRFDVKSVMHQAVTMSLRESVNNYIKANADVEDLATIVLQRVKGEFPLLQSLTGKQTIANFLEVLSRNGVWGSGESLYALAAMFEVDITIYRERGFETTLTNGNPNPNPQGTIKIVYRCLINHWNHYDSFLHFVNPSTNPHVINMVGVRENRSNNENWWDTVKHARGSCFVLRTAPDGNCLFSALAHQIFGHDIGSPSHQSDARLLRERTVGHIRANIKDPAYAHF